ncbi:MAG: substrate-binding domain-containing protein [Propionivibrio sp.]
MQRHGYHVPNDVSVACVNDPELLSYCYPSITTMSFDYRLTGMRAGQLLIDAIEGAQQGLVIEVVMPYALQSRDSTRALKTER